MNLAGVVEAMLDALMPPRARSARTKERRAEDIPLHIAEHSLLGAHITTLMDYRSAEVQDLIRALKYDGSSHAARLAAEVVGEFLREEFAEARNFSHKPILLVPLPLHASRKRQRGFNQIELVLRALPQEFRNGTLSKFAPHALERIRATPPQTKRSRAERIANMRGAFRVSDASLVAGCRVYLLDDVATTGATLVNAAEPLKAAGAEVSLLALARA